MRAILALILLGFGPTRLVTMIQIKQIAPLIMEGMIYFCYDSLRIQAATQHKCLLTYFPDGFFPNRPYITKSSGFPPSSSS